MDHQAIAQILGNYGEFVGSLAILATLVYLSIQVRQARQQQQINDRQTREFAIRDYQMNFAASDVLAVAVVKASACIATTSPVSGFPRIPTTPVETANS